MLLAIDIGNTNIGAGVFEGTRLIKRLNIPTQKYTIQNLINLLGKIAINDCIICSVVPEISGIIKRDLKKLLGKKAFCLGEDIRAPMKNLYRRPRQVGQDRLVNAYGAAVMYGYPAIVVDSGTAITFDVISKRKEYIGGIILPGLEISLDALAKRTALLPKIKINRPREFIGRDTRNSMLSGIIYGFAALIDDLAERIKDKVSRKAIVIGTGGNVELITKYCKNIDKIDKDLTLKGLNLIYSNR